MAGEIDEVDAARAQEYALLAALLTRAPDAELLSRISQLRADASPLGLAHAALAEAAEQDRRRASRARIFRSVHRLRPRRVVAIRLLLSHRLPARASAGAAARGSCDDRHRARRRRRRAGRSCRHPVRDHVRSCEPPAAGAAGFRSTDLRQAHGAVDQAFLRRSGECARLRISTVGWARSAASSWTSKPRPSSCRPKARRGIKNGGRIQGGNGDETTGQRQS